MDMPRSGIQANATSCHAFLNACAKEEHSKRRFVLITELPGVTCNGWQPSYWRWTHGAVHTPVDWLPMVADQELGVCTSSVPCKMAATEDELRVKPSADQLQLPRAPRVCALECSIASGSDLQGASHLEVLHPRPAACH